MKRFTHPSGSPTRPVHSDAMLQLLGVTGRLPAEGMPAREIQGIRVWVDPLPPVEPGFDRKRRCTHRVRCTCPDCGLELSAGRLHQHVCPT